MDDLEIMQTSVTVGDFMTTVHEVIASVGFDEDIVRNFMTILEISKMTHIHEKQIEKLLNNFEVN